MGYKHFGVKTGGIPLDIVTRFVNEWDIKVFIETGTAGGDSIRDAAHLFRECHTIEIVEGRPLEIPKNATLHIGDSGKLLKEISGRYNEKIFYWLDAHWSEPYESPDGTDECPIMKEIDSITKHDCVILIDDARLFYGRPPWPCDPSKGWPRLMHIFEKLRHDFPNHITTIIDDYILSFPEYMKDTHNSIWYNGYKFRFPTDEERLKQSAQQVYQALVNYVK